MKGIAKRAATIFLALAVIFTCTPLIGDATGGALGAQEVYAANFPDEISLNYTDSEGTHTVRLTAEKPYFKNGMPEAYSSVTGGDYNAWYDPSDHTLVLKDFDGNGIDERTGNADLTILLVGDNKIDTVGQSGLAIEGSIYITSTSGGKLTITNHSSYGSTFGIWARSDGDVYIYGSAVVDVTVDNTNTSSTSGCSGIHGYGNVEIRDHAKVSVRCTSTSPSSDSWGIYASKGLTISTDQPVDVSVKNDKDYGRVHGLHANGGDITISKTPAVTIDLSANGNNDIYVCSRISSLESSLDAIDYYGAGQESEGHILYIIGPKESVPEVINIQFSRTNLQRLTPNLTGTDVAAYFFPSILSPHGATCPAETPDGWYIRMGDNTGFGDDTGDPRDMEASTSNLEWYEPYFFSFEVLTDAGHKWNPDQDFTINGSDKDVIVSGVYEVDGKTAYQVSLKMICEDNLNRAQMSEVENIVYTGSAYTPTPTLTYGSETLAKDDHYTLSYVDSNGNVTAEPTNAGEYELIATGRYAFYGTLATTFSITPAEITAENVTGIMDKTYTGKAITQTPVVTVGEATLTAGTDYTVSYKNNTNVGTATVTITGKGNYTGTVTKTFAITKASVTITGQPLILNTIANSSKKTNDVIWDKSKVKNATAYEINWRARGATKWASRTVGNTVRGQTSGLSIKGLYEIRVRGIAGDNYNGKPGPWSASVYRYFFTVQKIRLKSSSKGTFTMSWAKDPGATSYQVMFTTNANGAGAAKNIRTTTGTSLTVSGLKSGQTYYVQVRAIKKVGSINYIGNISCPVGVKVR